MAILDQLRDMVTSRSSALKGDPQNPSSVPVVNQLVHTSAPYIPGVANYGASELPRPGQSDSNIPPRPTFVMTGRVPIGGHKTPASLGTAAKGSPNQKAGVTGIK